jgi:hypothetical protein
MAATEQISEMERAMEEALRAQEYTNKCRRRAEELTMQAERLLTRLEQSQQLHLSRIAEIREQTLHRNGSRKNGRNPNHKPTKRNTPEE